MAWVQIARVVESGELLDVAVHVLRVSLWNVPVCALFIGGRSMFIRGCNDACHKMSCNRRGRVSNECAGRHSARSTKTGISLVLCILFL